jgi:hypothetical protein
MKLIKQALLLVLVVTSVVYAQRSGHIGMPAAQHQNSREWIGRGISQEGQQEQMLATQEETITIEESSRIHRNQRLGCSLSDPNCG